HSIRRETYAPILGLVDNRSYYVVGCAISGCSGAGTFQLSNSLGGGAINLTFTPATGRHQLVSDIAPPPSSATQQLIGIGGVGFAATSGDGIISGAATGAGGGAINVATAESRARMKVTVSNTVEADAWLTAAGDVNVTTHGFAFAKTVASNDGGGFISVGTAGADTQ